MTAGCIPAILNNTASLGGNLPGERGFVDVVFINNTPYRALFTYGSYDQQDQNFRFDADQAPPFRQLGQFVAVPDPTNVLQAQLPGNTASDTVRLRCGRVLAVGTSQLIGAIAVSDLNLDLDPNVLVEGIGFSDRTLDDPQAGITTYVAPGMALLQGFDFPCGRTAETATDTSEIATVIFTFELDEQQPSGFRVDTQVILP